MKKIFASLAIVLCITLTMMGGGCGGCSSDLKDNENGGQTQVETITTLEGVWESEHGKTGEHEKIIIKDSSIKCYINEGFNSTDELEWAGIYIPFTDPVSEGTWNFREDPFGYPIEAGVPDNPGTRTFNYSNEKLSCNMRDANGKFRDIYFTKVSD